MIKLDYTIQNPTERKKLVEEILEQTTDPSPQYLEILADYLILCMEKQEKKQRRMLTENRKSTISKRETSFEGLVSQLENSEDSIYNMISDNNKNVIFHPKISISIQDLEDIPPLRQLKETISLWEAKSKAAKGRDAYVIKKALIEMRKDQYVIKSAYRCPVNTTKLFHPTNYVQLDEQYIVSPEGKVTVTGASLARPDICSAILCNYSRLKEDNYDNFVGDTWYLMVAFDDLCERALAPYPIFERIVEYKIDGEHNDKIRALIEEEFGVTYSQEYISTLWRNRIPKIIASMAEDDILNNHFLNNARGVYKRCTRCGQVKLAISKNYTKNNTSRDGWYSMCKVCRNRRKILGRRKQGK